MIIQKVVKLLQPRWSTIEPLDDVADFELLEDYIGQALPADYKFFIMWSNGGEILKPLSYYRFYRLDDLLELHKAGHPPAVLEFATDDSNGYAFNLSVNCDTAKYPIVRYALGDVDRTDVEPVAKGFADFMERIVAGGH